MKYSPEQIMVMNARQMGRSYSLATLLIQKNRFSVRLKRVSIINKIKLKLNG